MSVVHSTRKHLQLTMALLLAAGSSGCIERPPANGASEGGTTSGDTTKYSDLRSAPFLQNTGGTPQVYLLLGLWDVYSLGLNDLAAKMRGQGIRAWTISGPDWRNLAEEIIQAAARGTWRGDLLFVGHSYGGTDAIDLAKLLNEKHIPVRMLLLIDATNPGTIPLNVDRCIQWFQPNLANELFPDVFAGIPAQREPGNNHTQMVNHIIDTANYGEHASQMNHFTLDSEPILHQEIIEAVQSLEAGR